jgi:hypothetical protein
LTESAPDTDPLSQAVRDEMRKHVDYWEDLYRALQGS